MKKRKTIFAIALSLAMILTFMSIGMMTAYADDKTPVVSVQKNNSQPITYYAEDYYSETSSYNAASRCLDDVLANQLGGASSNDTITVTLLNNFDMNMNGFAVFGGSWSNPINSRPTVVFDLGGHTLNCTYENEAGTTFDLHDTDFVFQNGTVIAKTFFVFLTTSNSSFTLKSGNVFTTCVNGSVHGIGVSNSGGNSVNPAIILKGGSLSGLGFGNENNLRQFCAEGKTTVAVENGEYAQYNIVDEVAQIGDNKYATLQDAFGAASSRQTVDLLVDQADIGKLNIPAGVTFNGGGFEISGNSALNLGDGAAVTNTKFNNIDDGVTKTKYSNKGGSLTALYGKGGATVTNCEFENCSWEAIQFEPVANKEITITGNTFRTTDADYGPVRYVHVQSAKNVDFTVTVTGNKFYNGSLLDQTGLEVYYPTDASKVDLSGNYMDEPMAVCIGTGGTSYNNAAEKSLPFKDESLTNDVAVVASIQRNGNDYLYTSLAQAVTAAVNGETIKLLADVTTPLTYTDSTRALTLDLNGHNMMTNGRPVTVKSGAKLTITSSNATTQNATHNAVVDNRTEGTGSVGADGVGTEVTINAGYYYAFNGNKAGIHATNGAVITFNGGVVNGANHKEGAPEPKDKEGKVFYSGVNTADNSKNETPGKIVVHGGTFSGRMSNSNWGQYEIDGGTFAKDVVQVYNNPVDASGNPYGTSVNMYNTTTLAESGWVKSGHHVYYDETNEVYVVREGGHDFHHANPTDVLWKNVSGTMKAIFVYECSCGETEEVMVDTTYVDDGGIRTYTASNYGVTKHTQKELNFTVTLNGTIVRANFAWGDVCLLNSSDDSPKAWYVVDKTDPANKVADGTPSYTFPVTGNTEVFTGDPSQNTPVAAVRATLESDGANKAKFNAKWTIPTGSKVTDITIYRGFTANSSNISAATLQKYGSQYKVAMTAINGDFTLNLSGLTTGKWQHAVIIINYKDGNNEAQTLISSVGHLQIQ